MPRLRDTKVKAMSLVRDPANQRPFHAYKSADKEKLMTTNASNADAAEGMVAPPANVLASIQATLAKSASGAEGEKDALEAIAFLVHANKLDLNDVLDISKSAGAVVAKASDEKADKASKEEEEEEEADESIDDADMPDEIKEKIKNKKEGKDMPWPTKKTAKEPVMPVDIEKADKVEIMKAHKELQTQNELLLAEIAKARKEVTEERDYRVFKSIKENVAKNYKNLSFDHAKLATVYKSMRDRKDTAGEAALDEMFRAADAQVGFASRNGSMFGNVGKSADYASVNGSTAMDRINAAVDGVVQKSSDGKIRPQVMDEYLATPEGRDLWAEHIAEQRG